MKVCKLSAWLRMIEKWFWVLIGPLHCLEKPRTVIHIHTITYFYSTTILAETYDQIRKRETQRFSVRQMITNSTVGRYPGSLLPKCKRGRTRNGSGFSLFLFFITRETVRNAPLADLSLRRSENQLYYSNVRGYP
eukprot:scaffold6088_cov140-Skeletonema_dohrnii-CCMP3373.AAC.26